MKKTRRDNWRVVAVIRPKKREMSIGSLGFKDTWGKTLKGQVWGEQFEITVVPDGHGWVDVGDWTFSTAKDGEEGCKEIQKGLLKHPNVVEARVECDETHACAHCGCVWEELTEEQAEDPANLVDLHSVAGEPLCCEAAINEFRAERGVEPCST